ncbi:hypothetical protein B0H13DRAFT_2346041 [Mycena leptocephala]|nr:hypothetical protein B0H13DRAFT_2346041 [Mycena leptocephala]
MSTVEYAERSMSSVELEQLARRYQRMAEEARAVENSYHSIKDQENSPEIREPDDWRVQFRPISRSGNRADSSASDMLITVSPAIPSGEGSSKGKGPDPCNWGDVSLLENFTSQDLEAQREALANFAEIHRVIKEESVSTPTDFFGEIPAPKKTAAPKTTPYQPEKKEGTHPSADEIIAKLTRQLNESRQKNLNSQSVEIPSAPNMNQAKKKVQQNIAGLIRGSERPRENSVKPGRPVPARLALGSTIHNAIREAGSRR